MELNWVKPGGRKDIPGKPIQYVTTDDFLSHFNLQKLSDLPTVDELGAAGLIDSRVDSSIFGTSKFSETEKNDKGMIGNMMSMANSLPSMDGLPDLGNIGGMIKNLSSGDVNVDELKDMKGKMDSFMEKLKLIKEP